jgi:Zn-dependent protease with chaperone function
MMWAVTAALVSAVLLSLVAPLLARQMPPATAAIVLTGAAAAAIGGAGYALGTMAFTWIAQIPEVAEEGDWSPLLLRHENPVPGAVALASGAALAVSGVRLTRAARAKFSGYRQLRAALNGLPHDDGLVILDSHRPDAYATPAGGGRIVVTTSMLAALQPGEHRAVIAHERAHLALRHSWWMVAADLAAAANPLLRPTAVAVAESVERWADERAAETLGDRKLVARALARAALHANAAPAAAALGMVGGQMPRRVNALLAPPPRRRYLPLVTLGVLLATVSMASVSVETHADHLFDSATVAIR